MPSKELAITTRETTALASAERARAARDESRDRLVDRRLRVLGILLPVPLAIGLELTRLLLEAHGVWTPGVLDGWHAAAMLLVVAGIVCFALLMFRLLDRADRRVRHQNRDLTSANAVAVAVQGRDSVGGILEGALEALLRTAGVDAVRLTVDDAAGAPVTTRAGGVGAGEVPTCEPDVAAPLSHDGSTVGGLALWYPRGTAPAARVGAAALSSITTQVACAVQLASAVGDLNRRKVEGHAFYDILLRVSNQEPVPPVLEAIAGHAATLVGADAATVTVSPETARAIRFESGHAAPAYGSVDAAAEGGWAHTARLPVTGPEGRLGEIWAARRDGPDFTGRDRGFLGTLASLAGIALTGAQVRESNRQHAVLSERTRIAREMHDSLAQVLGAVHLRLRALQPSVGTAPDEQVAAEVEALADVCAAAYGDVREAILGLRDALSHGERTLEENLRRHLEAYASQSGIAATLVNEVGPDLALSPRAEVHVVRIVQEALTNVRKHSGARAVVVTVRSEEDRTTFAVADDGSGFDARAESRGPDGYGLFTMRDRAALLGGTLEVASAPGRGTTVTATVPERPLPSPLRSTT